MENIKPEDRPKLIVLILGVVLVFGFVLFQIKGALGGGGGSSTVKPTEPITVAMATPPAATPDPERIDVPTLFASKSLDPFQEVLPKKDATPPPPPATKYTGSPHVFRPGSRYMSGVPIMPNAMEGKLEPVTPDQNPTNTQIEVKRETPKLKGILYGTRPIAVFTLDQDEFVVGVGQQNPSGYTVQKIDATGVELRKGNETLRLQVGPSS